MSLSFQKEMEITTMGYIHGIDKVELIRECLDENPSWKQEAFSQLQNLFKYLIDINASDMDFGGPRANKKIWFRVHGEKFPDNSLSEFTADEAIALLLSILSDTQRKKLFQNKNIDFAYSLHSQKHKKDFRFRGNIYFERNTLAANFRLISQKIFKIETLGIPDQIIKRLDLEHEKSGLFLVTGITGSGKSTTLDSIIDMNNNKNRAQIILIGNPIEYIHRSKKCIISHRQVGEDVLSFQQGTLESLRQDPDIIVVGQMRDADTIKTILGVTDSGHKVFTTLHSGSSVESIYRIIAEFPPNEQDRIRYRLADVLKVIISQKLVPTISGERTLAKEILSVNQFVQAAIRNNNISEIFQMITEGKTKGMFTMQQDLYRLYKQKIITAQTAMNFANNRKVMGRLLQY